MNFDKPVYIFWDEWRKNNNSFPPINENCPRCGEIMTGGFWMHLCPDTREFCNSYYTRKLEKECKGEK